MPIVKRADASDSSNGGIGALASDINGIPTVAFPVPAAATIVTCQGPVNIIWFYAGAFGASDQLIDLYLTNVGVPQQPAPVSGSSSAPSTSTVSPGSPSSVAPITLTIATARQVTATNHFFPWQKVALPSGYYIINGTSVDEHSKIVFVPSAPFFISPGADTSCISINPPLPPQSTTSTTTSPSPSPTDAAQLQPSSSPTDIPLNEAPEAARTTSVDHRSQVIAGSVAGSLAIVLIIALFYVLLYLRRRRRSFWANPDAMPGKGRLQRLSSKPTPILPPPPAPPSSPVGADPSSTSVYLTVPNIRFPSEAERGADSFTTQRSQLQARWGWAVPLTPMFNLLHARRSSIGSDKFMSPAGVESPLPTGQSGSFAWFQSQQQHRGERSPLPSASFMQRSRMTSLAGLDVHMSEYERDRLHSLSEFRWVGEGFPPDHRASTVTIERLDTVDEKSTPSSTPTKEKK